MKTTIEKVESERNIKVIWLGLRGSDLKGYSTLDSDTDLIAIFIPSNGINGYLTLNPESNLTNFTFKTKTLDIQFLELKKALQLLIKNDVSLVQSVRYSDNLLNSGDPTDGASWILGEFLKRVFDHNAYMHKMWCIMKNYLKNGYFQSDAKEFISAGLIALSFLNDYGKELPPILADMLISHAKEKNKYFSDLAKNLEEAIERRKKGYNVVPFEYFENLKWCIEDLYTPLLDENKPKPNYEDLDSFFVYMVDTFTDKV